MIKRLILMLMLMGVLTACNRDNISVQPNGDGTATVSVNLGESEVNQMISTILAANANPLLRNPSVDLQNGQIVISGEHERRDGGGLVSGTLTMQISVTSGNVNAQISAVNIEGLTVNDERIAELNRQLAERLAGRARQNNGQATLSAINITNDALQIQITIRR